MPRHRHWWQAVAPTGEAYPDTFSGRALANEHITHERCVGLANGPDAREGCGLERPRCLEWGMDAGRAGLAHCYRPGKVLTDRAPYPKGDRRNPPLVDGGYYYCGVHDPVRRKAVQDKRDAAQAVLNRSRNANYAARRAEAQLAVEAERWYADELLVGEGFCEDICEHHACKLARAVLAVHEAREVRDMLAAQEASRG